MNKKAIMSLTLGLAMVYGVGTMSVFASPSEQIPQKPPITQEQQTPDNDKANVDKCENPEHANDKDCKKDHPHGKKCKKHQDNKRQMPPKDTEKKPLPPKDGEPLQHLL